MAYKKLPVVIAHRGLRAAFPENTKESIAAALALPVAGVEFDVDLTQDGVPILIHQETMVPNSGFTGIELGPRDEGRSWTHSVTWDQVRNFDVGSWLDPRHASVRFSTLTEVLELPWGTKEAHIELKSPYFYREGNLAFAQRIVEVSAPLIREFVAGGAAARVLSFDPAVIRICRELLPSVPRVLAFDPCFAATPIESVSLAHEVDAQSIVVWDKWILEDPRWEQKTSELQIALWAFEMSPDLQQMKQGTSPLGTLQANWKRIAEHGAIAGLHCDLPAECAAYFSSLR